MDIQTGLVYVGVVALSAVVIFVISMFGIKEKTYEEAIAEQRNMPEENLLLGRSGKDKVKNKKQKKAGKKVKEKPTEQEKKQSEPVSSVPDQPFSQEKSHTDLQEPETEVVNKQPPQEDKKKKKKEKERVKLVVLNINEQGHVIEVSPVPANHLEEIQPKGDQQLKQKRAKEDLIVLGGDTAVLDTAVQPPSAPEKVPTKQPTDKGNKKEDKATATAVAQEQPTPFPPSKDRNKKKRSELATLQQMSGDRDGVNVSLLEPLVRKAELSRTEIQILIDLLLNKQQSSATGNSEWIEGRQDPVVKLKKQLAEKEKCLQEEQEAAQSLQSKLKELRGELNSERSRLTHSCRLLEENLVTKQNEIQALAARLQVMVETHVAEKQTLTQQNQQLQAQVSDDHLLLRKLQEGEGHTKEVLEQEHKQRQQLELHISHLNDSHLEAEATLKGQIGQLHGELQEQERINASLSAELQKLREGQMERDGENSMLREQVCHQENQIRHLESQTAHLKQSSDQAQELLRQNEELHQIKTELEHHAANARQHEAALQYKYDNLCADVQKHEEMNNELKSEVSHVRLENEQLLTQVTKVKELQADVQHLQEENEHLVSQLSSFSQLEEEAQQLREENESLAAQVTAMIERPAAEGRENGDPEEKQSASEEGDVSQQASIVKQKELLLEKLSDELKQKDCLVESLKSEINTYKTEISKLNEHLESQRRKNNEISMKVRTEEHTATKEILQRIFPDIRIEDDKAYEVWVERFESSAKSRICQWETKSKVGSVSEQHDTMLREAEKQNSQLQAMVTHYKTIIEETEGMLNKLQKHVEQEEERWRQQLQIKDSELETIREENDELRHSLEQLIEDSDQLQRTEEMQSKLQELHEKLQAEELEKTILANRCEEIQNSCDQLKDQLNSNQQQLQEDEERERLTSELKTEQDRNHDLTEEVVKLRSLVQISQDTLNQKQQVIQQLQQQLDNFHVVNQNHSVATNGPATEPSITEGGSRKK